MTESEKELANFLEEEAMKQKTKQEKNWWNEVIRNAKRGRYRKSNPKNN